MIDMRTLKNTPVIGAYDYVTTPDWMSDNETHMFQALQESGSALVPITIVPFSTNFPPTMEDIEKSNWFNTELNHELKSIIQNCTSDESIVTALLHSNGPIISAMMEQAKLNIEGVDAIMAPVFGSIHPQSFTLEYHQGELFYGIAIKDIENIIIINEAIVQNKPILGGTGESLDYIELVLYGTIGKVDPNILMTQVDYYKIDCDGYEDFQFTNENQIAINSFVEKAKHFSLQDLNNPVSEITDVNNHQIIEYGDVIFNKEDHILHSDLDSNNLGAGLVDANQSLWMPIDPILPFTEQQLDL